MSLVAWEINPPSNSPVASLKEMWRGRSLFRFFAGEAVKGTYRRTVLGAFWMFVRPLMSVGVHVVFFALVLKIHQMPIPFPIYFLCGIMVWMLFTKGLIWAARSLAGQRRLISKIYFPRLWLPIAYLAPAVVDFLIIGAVLLVVVAVYFFTTGAFWLDVGFEMFWTVPITAMTLLFALGIGLWIAPTAVRSRDILITTRYTLGGWFLLTPVAYPSNFFTGSVAWMPKVNPMAPIVTEFRNAMTAVPVDASALIFPGLVTAVVLISGYIFFMANDAQTADRI